MLDFIRVRTGYVKVHWLITFLISAMFDEAGVAPLNLDPASGFLLNVFDVGASVSDNLRSQVESLNGLEIDGDALFRPLALYGVSSWCQDAKGPLALPNSSRST